jgi:protocadherin Fat 4
LFHQEPFNKISYKIIGDDTAPNYFRIDANNGQISISNNLANDGTWEYKVRKLTHKDILC